MFEDTILAARASLPLLILLGALASGLAVLVAVSARRPGRRDTKIEPIDWKGGHDS